MRSLRIHDVKWSTGTAGPGPDGQRTEIFLRGCRRARLGMPCPGCFNPELWSDKVDIKHPVDTVVRQVARFAPAKYVTIGGGEPTDQLYSLIDLCHGLKRNGFHVAVYTWRTLIELLSYHTGEICHLLGGIDILVDGAFDPAQKIFDEEAADGVRSWVGSGNQIIWDIHSWRFDNQSLLTGYRASDLESLALDGERLLPVVKTGASPVKLRIPMGEEDIA